MRGQESSSCRRGCPSARRGSGCSAGRRTDELRAPVQLQALDDLARVGASAVAVSAMRGTCGQRSCSRLSWRYSGGSRGPTATRSAPRRWRTARCALLEQRQEARREQAFGRDVEQVVVAVEQAALDRAACRAASEELRKAARTPSCCSASTWSCISAISGDTTMPVPRRSSAGTW
jgi:hypothetical protein